MKLSENSEMLGGNIKEYSEKLWEEGRKIVRN